MERVEARQRIKVATKDHILISWVHLKLYSKRLPLAVFLLPPLTVVVIGITAAGVAGEVVQGIMTAGIVVATIATSVILGGK